MALPPYTPHPNGILGSLWPIYEWWSFGFMYGETNWAEWSIQNANECYLEFHRENGNKTEAEIHVYGEVEKALPMLKDALRYFDVKATGICSFYDAFSEADRHGKSFKISVKTDSVD